jgi:hypothetical protein
MTWSIDHDWMPARGRNIACGTNEEFKTYHNSLKMKCIRSMHCSRKDIR